MENIPILFVLSEVIEKVIYGIRQKTFIGILSYVTRLWALDWSSAQLPSYCFQTQFCNWIRRFLSDLSQLFLSLLVSSKVTKLKPSNPTRPVTGIFQIFLRTTYKSLCIGATEIQYYSIPHSDYHQSSCIWLSPVLRSQMHGRVFRRLSWPTLFHWSLWPKTLNILISGFLINQFLLSSNNSY